jgi:hypothetical protein
MAMRLARTADIAMIADSCAAQSDVSVNARFVAPRLGPIARNPDPLAA